MGICSSKKAVEVVDVTKPSTKEAKPFTDVKTASEAGASRFEKVKIHAKAKQDPQAVVDEDV